MGGGIRMNKQAILIGPKIRGDVKLIRKNVLTGEIDLVVEKKNTILNALYQGSKSSFFRNDEHPNSWGTRNVTPIAVGRISDHSIRKVGTLYSCSIGTSNDAPTRSDNGIKGSTLATSNSGKDVAYSAYGTYPVYMTRKWIFAAGIGTGNIGEVVLKAMTESGTCWEGQVVARQVFDPVIEKNDYHELTVEWTITMTAETIEGDIPNGQRDGVTSIHWKSFINYRQLWAWAFGNLSTYSEGAINFKKIEYSSLIIEPYYVITGDSNADSDLANDAHNTLKGNQLYSGFLQLSSTYSYVMNSYYRDIRLGFDTNQSNGSIGELLLRCRQVYQSDYGEEYICRITFNPPLDKTNAYQLYIDLRLGLNLS